MASVGSHGKIKRFWQITALNARVEKKTLEVSLYLHIYKILPFSEVQKSSHESSSKSKQGKE